jgi:HEAT repeat protein
VALDREIANAGLDSAKLNAIAARLISLLRDPATTPAARQAIAQRLTVFPASALTAGENPALFAAMFTDPREVNNARLALDLVPGSTVDALYLDALKASVTATRLAIIQSIGRRRIPAAVPLLRPLLNDRDAAVVGATIDALASIGTQDALDVVSLAPNPNSARVVEAVLTIAHQIGGAQATRIFRSVSESPDVPAHLRAAGFRGLLMAEPNNAPTRVTTALAGDDAALKPVVIEAIAFHPANDLVPALATQLATWEPATQAAVITALGRKGDAAAVPAISTAAAHADPDVRAAAIVALGQLPGNREIAFQLARIIDGDNAEEAKLARQSLSRLTGPGVAETVLNEATRGEQPLRTIFVEQLATRNVASSVPLLLSMRNDPDPAIRSAALGSLAEIAEPSDQRAILDWAIDATDSSEQSRALRALASVTLRNPDVAERSTLVIQAIETAPTPVVLRLLPVLPRISGAPSAESAARLALRDDAAISTASINTLSRWNDRAGLFPLVNVAEKTTSDKARTAAIEGVVRYIERNRDLPSTDLVAIVTRLVPICQETETKSRLVYLLGRSSGDDALAAAEKFQTDPALASVATDAAAIIRANAEGRPSVRASGNERQVANIVDGKMSTRWTVPARSDAWIEVDFKLSRPFRQIVLDNDGATWGSPEEFAVFVTDNVNTPGEARVTGSGQTGKTTIDLPPGTRGRYLIIRHTGESEDSVWAISELLVD